MGKTGQAFRVSDAAGGHPARRLVTRFALNRSGATALEYGLLAALLSVAIIVALLAVSDAVQNNLYTVMEAAVVD